MIENIFFRMLAEWGRNSKLEIRNKFEYQMKEFSKLKWIDS